MGGKGKGGVDAVDVDQDEALNAAADGATENADGAAQRLQEQHDQQAGFDAEGQHSIAVDRIEAIVDQTMLNSDELIFDLRDTVLEIIKTRPKPWSGTSQEEQRDIAAAVEIACKELVRKTVEVIASNGTASHRILLTKFNQSGTDMIITGKVKYHDDVEKHRAIIALSDSLNKHVMLTRASADDYVQGEREPDTQEDQAGFGFEGGDPPSGDDDDND